MFQAASPAFIRPARRPTRGSAPAAPVPVGVGAVPADDAPDKHAIDPIVPRTSSDFAHAVLIRRAADTDIDWIMNPSVYVYAFREDPVCACACVCVTRA